MECVGGDDNGRAGSGDGSLGAEWMSREAGSVSGRTEENGVKVELCSPGPATPMQVAPLPQQKPREEIKSSPFIATTKAAHSSEPAKTSCGSPLASGPLKTLLASTQDAIHSEKGNAPVLTPSNECSVGGSQTVEKSSPQLSAVKHGIGHPPLSGGLGTMGGPTKAVLKDEVEVRVASKASEDEASMSSCGAIERASYDRSMTSMTRASSDVKVESSRYALDAGLSLDSKAVQVSWSKERDFGELGGVWENGAGSAGRSGIGYVPSSRDEGTVVLQLSQGRGADARGDTGETAVGGEWKGKHLELSFGFQATDKDEGGRVEDGKVDHSFSQVLEEDVGVFVEQGAKGCTDASIDRLTKRVKREVAETRMSVDECREQIWEMNEDQGRRSGMYKNQQDHFRSLFLRNGGAALFSQSYTEKAIGKVLEMGGGEPKTMVVKKTPKRVHNSDPSTLFMRSDLMMFEDSAKSPRSIPHAMFSPLNKQGMNGVMLASDSTNSASQYRVRKPANLVCGREGDVECSKGIPDGSSLQQFQLESRMDRGSTCSLMSTAKHGLLMGEPSLPLSLNFSPKPQRPVVSISRNSTEEEWGKSLALCGPGAESPGEVERSGEEAKTMSYQERFVQLQVFLKKCDEDDQSYLLDALRSLSAAARSSHAVGLEQRALWLSIEEGKEMARLKSLNVLGQRSNMKGQSEVGCTPQGPRISSFGSGAEYAQQQLLTSMRSPQVQTQTQMLMSGSMPGSAYIESYHSG